MPELGQFKFLTKGLKIPNLSPLNPVVGSKSQITICINGFARDRRREKEAPTRLLPGEFGLPVEGISGLNKAFGSLHNGTINGQIRFLIKFNA